MKIVAIMRFKKQKRRVGVNQLVIQTHMESTTTSDKFILPLVYCEMEGKREEMRLCCCLLN